MDNMPLEGYMWEFIRRNHEYRKYYSHFQSELKKPLLERNFNISLYSFLHRFGMDVNRNFYYPFPEEKFLIIENDKTKGERNVIYGIPNPDIPYREFEECYLEKRKEPLVKYVKTSKPGKHPKNYQKDLEKLLKIK